MEQELIKPNRKIASHFVAAIISFLRGSFGEKEYNELRIGDPTKKISEDYGSVQFSSLSPGKEVTSLWNFLQKNDAGLVAQNITPGGSDEKVTAIKISLNLPKEFLVEYGNEPVKDFCKESDDSSDQNDSSDTPGQDKVESQPNSVEGEEDTGIIKTVEELREAVADVSDSRAKSRTVSTFFKWYLEQNGITEYAVLPRTAYKYQGKEPEFVVRILVTGQVLVALETLQSQGCDVDTVGQNEDAVRVKALVVDSDSLSKNAPQGNRQRSSDSKKSTTKKKAVKKKMTKKVGKKFQLKVQKRKSDTKPKTNSKPKAKSKPATPQSKSVTEIVLEFLRKDSPTEQDTANFRKIIAFKQSELEILKRMGASLDELVKLRKRFDEM